MRTRLGCRGWGRDWAASAYSAPAIRSRASRRLQHHHVTHLIDKPQVVALGRFDEGPLRDHERLREGLSRQFRHDGWNLC